MTTELLNLVLVGHDCPLGAYPCVVVPVTKIGQRLAVVYLGSEGPDVVEVPNASRYIEHSAETNRALAHFDYREHGLFAFSEQSVVCYRLAEQGRFFSELLGSSSADAIDPFYRLSLARETQQHELIEEAFNNCVRQMHSDCPQFVEDWIRQNQPAWMKSIKVVLHPKETSDVAVSESEEAEEEGWRAIRSPITSETHRLVTPELIWGVTSKGIPSRPDPFLQRWKEAFAYDAKPLVELQGKIAGLDIGVEPPSRYQSLYECQLKPLKDGPSIKARLTYDLLDRPPRRRLLCIDSESASTLWNLDKLEGFRELDAYMMFKRSQGLGRISTAKQTVIELAEGESLPSHIGITVHRFGAVPVALLPSIIRPLGSDTDLQVAIYPSSPRRTVTQSTAGSSTKIDVLRSCRVGLDVLFQSYLEDVAAEFHDIEHRATFVDVYRRLRRVEEILAMSVQPKLDLILRHLNSPSSRDLYFRELARDVWLRFSPAVVQTAYANVLALYLVNQLYECIGVQSRVKTYEDQWDELAVSLERIVDDELAAQANKELYAFTRTLRRAFSTQVEHREHLRREVQGPLWLQDFVAFSEFVAILKSAGAMPKPKLFLASHHTDAEVPEIRAAIRDVRGDAAERSRLILTHLAHGGEAQLLGRTAKAHIWFSQGVLAFIRRDATKTALDWLHREAEYAAMMARPVHVFVEEGLDPQKERALLEIGLASTRVKHANREQEKKTSSALLPGYRYDLNHHIILSGAAQTSLAKAVEEAEYQMVQEVLIGSLAQFTPHHQTAIAMIFRLVNYGMKKRELIRKLSEKMKLNERQTRRVFDHVWRNIKQRSLVIDGQSLPLLSKKDQIYINNLRGILHKLLPEALTIKIEDYYLRILADIERASGERRGVFAKKYLPAFETDDSLIPETSQPPAYIFGI